MAGDNKLTFDPLTCLPELTQNWIRSFHGHSTPSLKSSCKSVQPFSHNVANKEINERKKSLDYNTPSPYRGPGYSSIGAARWRCNAVWNRDALKEKAAFTIFTGDGWNLPSQLGHYDYFEVSRRRRIWHRQQDWMLGSSFSLLHFEHVWVKPS